MREIKQFPLRRLAPAAFAAALAAGSVHAQQPQSTAAGNLNAARQQQSAEVMPQQQAAQRYHGLRASKVIGTEVRNRQGQQVGEIEDIVLNTNNGNVRFAMLRFDPGLFSGERLFAVPMSQLQMAPQGEHVTLDIQRERLERSAVDRSAWNQDYFADLRQVRRIDEAWNVGQRDATPVVRASDLLGKSFRGANGETAGTLEELVINGSRGQVHYAVASMDRGWLGEERRVTLPLRAFQRSGDGSLTLNMNKAQVAGMRNFDQRQYGNLDDRVFLVDVDRYLVLVPTQSSSTGATGNTSSSSSGGSDARTSGAGSATLQTPQGSTGTDVEASTDLQAPQQASDAGTAGTDTQSLSYDSLRSDQEASVARPGLEADLTTSAGVQEQPDTRTLGAGPAVTESDSYRAPIQDRN